MHKCVCMLASEKASACVNYVFSELVAVVAPKDDGRVFVQVVGLQSSNQLSNEMVDVLNAAEVASLHLCLLLKRHRVTQQRHVALKVLLETCDGRHDLTQVLIPGNAPRRAVSCRVATQVFVSVHVTCEGCVKINEVAG
jgi:hypothetical protein